MHGPYGNRPVELSVSTCVCVCVCVCVCECVCVCDALPIAQRTVSQPCSDARIVDSVCAAFYTQN